ncbi:LamG-like jellyroll fold domain-containing protein [Streptomyces sp. NPDC102473]|uniref:LamG-like jellyroll fold domain-containing protein n=1 Tax=Streptomyces sp. NPDC102473 TaxID=3366180 RepID=UPI00381E1A5E
MPVLVEMGWGGLVQYPWSITWTDITNRVDMVQGVTITRGASDELSETQPGTATMTLDNQDGWLTPGNPNSGYAPYVRKNAPVRISMAVMPTQTGAAPWPVSMMGDTFDGSVPSGLWPNVYGGAVVVGGRARIPLTPGGSAGIQSARSWTLPGASVCARMSTAPTANGSSAALSHFLLDSTTNGTRIGFQHNVATGILRCVSLVGFVDGSSVDIPYSGIDHLWLRIRETSGLVIWETSGDGWDWTVRRTLATPAWVSSQQLIVSFTTSRTGGTGDYVEWDLVGAQVRPRFYGVVNEFPVEWEGLMSSVTISATDIFKRLNRLPALRSMLGMEVLTIDTTTGAYSFPAAYFPLSEPAESASAGDVVGRGASALVSTVVGAGGTLTFGDEGVPETGESAVTFTPTSATAGRYLVGDLGPQTAADSTTWLEHIQVWIKTSTVGRAILGMHDPVLDHQLILALNGSGVLTLETTQDGSALTVATTTSGNLANNTWHHIVYDGSSKKIYVDGASVSGTLVATSTQDIRSLYIGGYRSARLFSGQIAHVSLHLANAAVGSVYAASYDAITGFTGETADWRVERLARYAGLSSVTVLGSAHDPIASQGPAGSSVVARLREVESTESGRLYAERDYFGLAYQSRDLRFNPDVIGEIFAISYADLEPGIQLADDDQKLVNEIEASRPGGATQTVTAPSSIFAFGTYPQQLNLLKTTDNAVTDAASWKVLRYANPEPELREVPIEAFTLPEYLDILDADISSYFTVYDLPEQATATEIRSAVEGYNEQIKEQSHVIQFRTSSAAQDSVWVIGDPVYGVLGSTSRLAY